MKYVFLLGLLVITGCQSPVATPLLAAQPEDARLAVDNCPFASMVMNGASSADAAKTSAICESDHGNGPNNRYIIATLRTDSTGYTGIGAAGGAVAPLGLSWRYDSAACAIHYYDGSGDLYTLTNPVLNPDKTLYAVRITDIAGANSYDTDHCYRDYSPGH